MTATDASPALRRLASSAGQRQRQLASDGTNAAQGCSDMGFRERRRSSGRLGGHGAGAGVAALVR